MSNSKCVSQDPHVTQRLLTIIVLLICLLCLFGGYLLGRAARPELRKTNNMLTYNLTIMAERIYKKAKRIPPKLIHQNELDKIQFRLLEIFNCSEPCDDLNQYNLAEFVRNSMNYQVKRLMKAAINASVYLDSLHYHHHFSPLLSTAEHRSPQLIANVSDSLSLSYVHLD